MAPRKARSWLVAVLLVAAVAAGCGSDDTTQDTDDGTSEGTDGSEGAGGGEIEDREWVLDADASGVTLGEGEAVTFLIADGRFGGFNVCNSFEGKASIDGDEITITETMSTLAGCFNAELSTAVDEVLRGTATFEVDGDRLVMRGESGEATLEFVEVPPSIDIDQAALAGRWQVAPPTGGPPAATTLTFAADGSYEVTTECGRYIGQWEVDRGRIAFPGTGSAISAQQLGDAPGPGSCGSGEDASIEPSADEVLVTSALAGAHLRPGADGRLEVLDRTGVPVALLIPAGG